jgi:hypothetical protein
MGAAPFECAVEAIGHHNPWGQGDVVSVGTVREPGIWDLANCDLARTSMRSDRARMRTIGTGGKSGARRIWGETEGKDFVSCTQGRFIKHDGKDACRQWANPGGAVTCHGWVRALWLQELHPCGRVQLQRSYGALPRPLIRCRFHRGIAGRFPSLPGQGPSAKQSLSTLV